MKTQKIILLATLALLLPSPSWATAIFTPGNNPQPGEVNVLLSNGTTGNTVQGTTNMSGFAVNFISTQTITEPSSGQARIEATNNGSQVGLTNVNFSLANGGTFTDAIFSMSIGGTVGASGGTATITAVTNDGTFTFMQAIGNGSNFLTITTSGGETINSVGISYANGLTDLEQVRISGAAARATVPETGATVSLLGLGLAGLGIFRRKLAGI